FEKKKPENASLLDSRIEESQFTWLGGNVDFVTGSGGAPGAPVVDAPNLARTALVESGGIKVGIFGVVIPTAAVQYVQTFEDPVETARTLSADLRARGAEVVIGVTHLNARDDRRLLETLGSAGPDLILGGHDHERMACSAGGRQALKADADIRTATVARLTLQPGGRVDVCWEFPKLASGSPAPDPAVSARVHNWLERHEKLFCDQAKAPADCLSEEYTWTKTVLEAEESKIRGQETSLGDWIADRMVDAFVTCGAQASFINAGTLRLNQDLQAGARITRRTVEELFGFPAPLHLLRIDGRTLQQVAEHAIVGWPGSGNWLQVSGISYVHDTEAGTIRDLRLTNGGVSRPVQPDDTVMVVTNDYLVNPSGDQDGYTMLNQKQIVDACAADGTDLKQLVIEALEVAGEDGIEPELAGRIKQVGEAAQPPCSKEERPCGGS
ncbi:MAG TPA: 5'-nucleotidase C-terminal domain-containing protein, partial [Thermoanaerobaculia bacterium]|nr:5'-nucleotidase C-terminal domain-containing protein [Thermoanaerobaculia bacterium]